jgi:hypothetical protein
MSINEQERAKLCAASAGLYAALHHLDAVHGRRFAGQPA